ncbi:hypothetical protein LR69_00586 [Geobacillus sp. BCO2]|nr:hypothetical protein LR69_00586 [Geobacillus sp. BCO2]
MGTVIIFALVTLLALYGMLRTLREKNVLGFLFWTCHYRRIRLVYHYDHFASWHSNRHALKTQEANHASCVFYAILSAAKNRPRLSRYIRANCESGNGLTPSPSSTV